MKKPTLKHVLANLEEYSCFGVSVILLLLTFANVISRYFIHASISFTDEITTNLFVLLSIMGTALAVKRGAHLGLSVLTDSLPPKASALAGLFSCVLGMAVAVLLFYVGGLMVNNQLGNGAVTVQLQIPAAIYGSFLPIGMFFVTLRFGQKALEFFRLYRAGGETKKPVSITDKTLI